MFNSYTAVTDLIVICRLKVPRYRSMLEYVNFLVLFILYVIAIEGLVESHINGREWAFIIYAMGEYDNNQLGTDLNCFFSILPR